MGTKINVLSKNKKIVKHFQIKNVIFTGMINRCMLHGCVFVMDSIVVGFVSWSQDKRLMKLLDTLQMSKRKLRFRW